MLLGENESHFDVMRQSWISAIDTDGNKHVVGLRELLVCAHHLHAVQDISPLIEYGIYRLLTVLIMDMHQPKDLDELQDLLAVGKFDEQQVEDYICQCEKLGSCFDMFDYEMPFLQTAYDSSYDLTRKPVAELLHDMPCGNNHVHFEHTLASEHVLSFEDCAKAICATNIFCAAGTHRLSSVNGAPPLYVLVKGNTLFETIVLNCTTAASTNMAYSTPPPAWRDKKVFAPGQKMAVVSLLEGMTFRARRITLIPSDGMVSELYFQNGLDFVGHGSWRDPHTIIDEKSGASVKPRQDKDTWRNIGMMFGGKATSPIVVQQYFDLAERKRISAILYGLVTTQASYESWFREEMAMPTAIANSPAKMQILMDAIALTETIAAALRKSLRNIKDWESITVQTVSSFYAAVRDKFFGQLCSTLECEMSFDQEQAIEAIELWKSVLRAELVRAFNTGADRLGSSAHELMKRAKASNQIGSTIAKYLKREDVTKSVG